MKIRILWMGLALILGLFLVECDLTQSTNADEEMVEEVENPEETPDSPNNKFPDFCPIYPVPAGTTQTFELSQDYPTSYDANDEKPWLEHDFKTDYSGYLKSVLSYCMEGNVEVDFSVQDNKVRKWYSAPWMHDDGKTPEMKKQNSGRECLHGLTREITISAYELHPLQTNNYQTYAIAFYNPPGGHTIGKVWADPTKPIPKESEFPEGTVTFKLLFTEAPLNEVPFLEGSKEWTANIFVPYDNYEERTNHTVRIVQLDVMVKDNRADTGWVMGTFIYNGASDGAEWHDRMEPVGLMWGDDAGNQSLLNNSYAYNPDLKQSVINPTILHAGTVPANPKQGFVRHLGMGGRMNGPVDNPVSSCNSCHARAAVTDDGHTASIANFKHAPKVYGDPSSYTPEDFNTYFSNVKCGVWPLEDEGTTYTMTDFSFQITNGIRNYYTVNHDETSGKEKPIKRPRSAASN